MEARDAGGLSVDLPLQGSLEEQPLPLLLARLTRARASAIIDLASGDIHRRIYVEGGRPIFMQSNAEGENVAGLLYERGRITERDANRVQEVLHRGQKTMQRALLDLRLVDEAELARAYLVLAGRLLPKGFAMTSGPWRLALGDGFAGRVPSGDFEMPSLVLDGIRRFLPLPSVFRWFEGREDVPLRSGPSPEAWWAPLHAAFPELGAVEEGAEFRSLVKERPRPGALLGLYAAVALELLSFVPLSAEDLRLRTAVEAASDSSSPDLSRALDQVAEVGMGLDLFQLLGATAETTPESLDLRYIERAIRWRPDHFAELDPRRARLMELRRRLDVAYDTLRTPERRREYELFLDRRARGLTTDVRQIADAEELYQRALPLIEGDHWTEATPLLMRALQLDPEPQVRASLAWVEARAGAISREHALDTIEAALKEEPLLTEAWVYAARLHTQAGRKTQAQTCWRRVLERDPRHREARASLD
ncbi:MAG: J domain-containing protein [Myxococcota bacterium]